MEATMSSGNMWMQFMIAAMLWEQKAPQEKMAQQKNQCKNYHMTELSHISWRPLFFFHPSPVLPHYTFQ